MKKQYFVTADVIRILAGCAVVFIHITDPFLTYPPYYGVGGFSYLILSFLNAASRVCVPLFILLSGYLLLRPEKNIRFIDFYKRRISRIGIPLIFWLVMYFLIFIPSQHAVTTYYILSSILSNDTGVLYFLIIILELYALTPLLLVFLQHTNRRSHTILFISSIFLTVGLNLINTFIPAASVATGSNILTIFLPFLSYYIGGYYLRNIALSSTQKIWILFGFWIVLLFTLFSTDSTAVSAINASERQFNSINVFIMSILAFVFLINDSFVKRKFSSRISVVSVKIIAGTIFGIYLIHPYILMVFDNYLRLKPGDIYSPLILFVFLKTAAVFILSFGIVAIGKKIPIFGNIFGE